LRFPDLCQEKSILAFCTGVGWLLRGMAGAVIALLAASIPCAIIPLAGAVTAFAGLAS
jgi:chromate transporter